MEITGKLKEIFDTQVVSEKFKKREFVLTTEENTPYPQQISFQVTQDKCELLDLRHEGEEIKVQFNLRGREWNGPQGIKYFNTLEAWRVEKIGGATAQIIERERQAPTFTNNSDEDTDLPF